MALVSNIPKRLVVIDLFPFSIRPFVLRLVEGHPGVFVGHLLPEYDFLSHSYLF